MSLQTISERLAPHHLDIFGALHSDTTDNTGPGKTIVLLGPKEPGFWNHFKKSDEWNDGAPDPLDRWSERVVAALAMDLGADARLPFSHPPQPFLNWALRSGRAWNSPVHLLVHETAGLWLSFRGALVLPGRLDLPLPPAQSPCTDCADKPCLSACPAQALTGERYDLPTCHSYLDTAPGRDCLSQGCAVRRACPISQSHPRLPLQSAYHMEHFHE